MTKDVTIEITDRVERMDALEDRFGVNLEALYAVFQKDDYRSEIVVNYDLVAHSGSVSNSIKLNVSAYNARGQLVGTTYSFVDEDDFVGFASFSDSIECEAPPAKIRVYPTSL